MTTSILFTAAPSSGFDDPFGMLDACHDRVRRMLDLLARLREHLRTRGADEQARDAARDVMRYFDIAAPAHHEDEERHVFPLLKDKGLHLDAVAQMERDHLEIHATWVPVRRWLEGIAAGSAPASDRGVEALLDGFARIHASHLLIEDSITHPKAESLCDEPMRAAMGREMAGRRGVKWGDGPAAIAPTAASPGVRVDA